VTSFQVLADLPEQSLNHLPDDQARRHPVDLSSSLTVELTDRVDLPPPFPRFRQYRCTELYPVPTSSTCQHLEYLPSSVEKVRTPSPWCPVPREQQRGGLLESRQPLSWSMEWTASFLRRDETNLREKASRCVSAKHKSQESDGEVARDMVQWRAQRAGHVIRSYQQLLPVSGHHGPDALPSLRHPPIARGLAKLPAAAGSRTFPSRLDDRTTSPHQIFPSGTR